jgi:hypothetical protein
MPNHKITQAQWDDAKRVARQGLALRAVARITGIAYTTLCDQRRREPENWPPISRDTEHTRDCSHCDLRRLCSQWFCVCEHYRPWDPNHQPRTKMTRCLP